MRLRITVEGKTYDVDVQVMEDGSPQAGDPVPTGHAPAPAATPDQPTAPDSPAATGTEVKSPIAGTVVDIKVQPGQIVETNQTLLVLEAMKMESNISAPIAGTVKQVHIDAGDSVAVGQVLVSFE